MPEGLFTGLAKCGTEPSASSHCGSGCGNELRSALRKPGSMDPAHSSGSGSSTVCRRMCGRADKGVKASAGPDMASSGATDAAISQSGPTPSNASVLIRGGVLLKKVTSRGRSLSTAALLRTRRKHTRDMARAFVAAGPPLAWSVK